MGLLRVRARVRVGTGARVRAKVGLGSPHRLAHDPSRLAARSKELATAAEQAQPILASEGGGGAEVYLVRVRLRVTVRGRVVGLRFARRSPKAVLGFGRG